MRRILASILFFLSLMYVHGEVLYFTSNSVGMALEKVTPLRSRGIEYFLKVETAKESPQITKTLFHHGEEEKRWEVYFINGTEEKELYRESGEKISETHYDRTGRILSIRFFSSSQASDEFHQYLYQGDLLKEVVVTQGDKELYRNIYFRSPDGRLRRVEQRLPDKEKTQNKTSLYTASDGVIIQEWHGTEATGDLFSYDSSRNIHLQERWKNKILIRKEEFAYTENGGKTSVSVDTENNITEERWYDTGGSLTRILRRKESTLLEDTHFAYSDGHVVEKVTWSPGVREKWEYTYNEKGALESEKYYKDNMLKTITYYTGDGTYYQDIYHRGKAFIRVYYENHEKVKEELLISR